MASSRQDVASENTATVGTDEAELAKLGYKQELKRDLHLLQNFGVSFSIISVITGIPSLFLFGLTTGGPAVMVWGWWVVALFTLFVGLSMAEICSSCPTSGGPYFWAAKLARPSHAPFASWVTGWFNLLGQVAVTTGISYACATFVATAATLQTSFVPNSRSIIGIYAAVLVTQGLINTFGVHLLRYLNNISIAWHALGTTALIIAVLAAAPTHQSGTFVFRTFIDGTGPPGSGWSERASPAYVVCIGVLLAQYTLTGFDASAHMTEETHNAATAGSWGIVMAISVSAFLGWFLIVGLLFSIQDLDATLAPASGEPVTQIFLDTCGSRGAIVLMVIVIGAMFWCGTFSITANSRMMYAFSRDGALPRWLHSVDAKRKSPIRTVWLAVFLSFCLGLPSLGSSVAFTAATSIATIGLYISYGIPIALRVLDARRFRRGPWHLGRWGVPVGGVAVCWIMTITIFFILPQVNPVTSQTFNYAVVAVGIVVTYSLGMWLVFARRWFKGPIRQIKAEEAGIDVMDPDAFAKAEKEGRLEAIPAE